MQQETYSLEDAATYLNVGVEVAKGLFQSGEIVAAKIGRNWSVRRIHLEEYHDKEAHRQTLERREAFLAGVKPHVGTAFAHVRQGKRNAKPDLNVETV